MTAMSEDIMSQRVWCLVDDFGDGQPSIGPFATCQEAGEFDPHDERFEPREITLAEWVKALVAIRVRQEMRKL